MVGTEGSKQSLEKNSLDDGSIIRKRIVREEFKIILKIRSEDEGVQVSPIVLSRELKKMFGEVTVARVEMKIC